MIAVPVGDVANAPTHFSSLAGNTVSQTFQNIAKMTLDALAYGAGQMALNQITDNMVSWIQGGFHGNPSFAIDIEQIEEDMIDAVAGDLINQVKDLSVCQFRVNYTDDLIDSILLSSKKKKAKHVPTCPVDLSMNFYASDAATAVNNFGWSAFGSALSDGGSPYSVQIATAQELAQKQADSKKKSDQKLSWSNGYIDLVDTTKCSYPASVGDNWANYSAAQKSQYQKQYCKTTTPGNIVSSQLTSVLKIDMDRLGFADNMNKIISAVLNQMTKKAVQGVFTATGVGASHSTQTPNIILATTLEATFISQYSATLNGAVSSNSAPATVWFDWGPSSSFGNSTAGKSLLGVSGATTTSYDETLDSLSANTKYYYRAVTQNAKGRAYGSTLSFTTNQ